MFDPTLLYVGFIVTIVLLIVVIIVNWPTPRKLLEYENKNLRAEAEQNNLRLSSMQKNVEMMRNKENKRDEEIAELHQIITILAKAQGIKDWRKELLRRS